MPKEMSEVLCSAIILAGGQSSRMGQDKALLRIDNTPLLQRTCQVALQCVPFVYVVTPWPHRYQAIIPPTCQVIQETVTEPVGTCPGPLMGFAQGILPVKTEWLVLLACDLPYLSVSYLETGMQNLAHVPAGAIALLPRQSKGWEPLCGFYRRQCSVSLEQYIEQGGRSFQGWLSQQVIQELPVSDPRVLFNCNTPFDWQTVLQAKD